MNNFKKNFVASVKNAFRIFWKIFVWLFKLVFILLYYVYMIILRLVEFILKLFFSIILIVFFILNSVFPPRDINPLDDKRIEIFEEKHKIKNKPLTLCLELENILFTIRRSQPSSKISHKKISLKPFDNE